MQGIPLRLKANPRGSHIHATTTALCRKKTTMSAPSITTSAKDSACSSSSSSLCRCLIHCFIALFLSFWCSTTFPPHYSPSLILSCVSVLCSACAQRMLNMCSGWGWGTADFIGGTLTSHTDRLGRMAQYAHILATAALEWKSLRFDLVGLFFM